MSKTEITTNVRTLKKGEAVKVLDIEQKSLDTLAADITELLVKSLAKQGKTASLVRVALDIRVMVLVPPATEGGAA